MTGPDDPRRAETARWLLVRAILDEAFERPPAERSAFLDRQCADEPELRAEVESLLAADARIEGGADFLRSSVDAVAEDALREAAAPVASVASGASVASLAPSSAWAGRRVGSYRITRLLGEGGMGVVFEAEQDRPRRLVALKVVRGGLFVDDARLRLFQREAEALARLQHPGIAAIHEAGRTGDGQHYFAMELAHGLPLDTYLAGIAGGDERPGRRARLALFLQIADAIAYAHQRGVIHRDLKPSNVVVDEAGRAKVLDFGLARITDGDVALSTVATNRGVIQGTLPYMSPEQAAGDPGAIDLRSDVYSLGVLLFEMLTGHLPIDVRSAALPEAVRAIAQDSPARPASLVASLRGDLDTILLKALAKEPAQRYQTVSAFAEDVRRHLDDQPILARPPSTVEQLKRLARRHRVAAALGAAALAALVAGVVGTTAGMLRARAAERSAREEAATAARVSDFLVSLFSVSDPSEARGNSITARELLDRGVVEVDSALAGEPRVRGRLLGTMGQVYRNLGLYAQARPLLERSLAVRSANPDEDPVQLARSHFSFAGLLRRLGEYDDARTHYQAALAIRESTADAPPEEVAASLLGLANLHYDRGEYALGLPLNERAVALARDTLGEDHYDYPSFLSGLAFTRRALGEHDAALALMAEVVQRREKALGTEHPTLANDLYVQADFLREAGRPAEALPVLQRALAMGERTMGPEHAYVGEMLNTRGLIEMALGDAPAAEHSHRRALLILEKAFGPEHALTAATLDTLAESVARQGRRDEALALSDRAGRVLDALPAEHPSRRAHEGTRARILAD